MFTRAFRCLVVLIRIGTAIPGGVRVVGFSVVSVQRIEVAYTLAVLPGLVGCLALHSRQSEEVLRTIRKYLYQMEKRYGYSGYEHYTRMMPRSTHGAHMDALRYAFV